MQKKKAYLGIPMGRETVLDIYMDFGCFHQQSQILKAELHGMKYICDEYSNMSPSQIQRSAK
jgi:hypothetical protein